MNMIEAYYKGKQDGFNRGCTLGIAVTLLVFGVIGLLIYIFS